jgi:GMP synthase (glutamine-hydrolysing)
MGQALLRLGFDLDIRCPACDRDLPEHMDDHAGVVVFGGPMSANDDHLPFVRKEIDWIPVVMESGKPFLGICLGAQMLARTLGARVSHHPEGLHEIGYFPIRPTPEGRAILDGEQYFYQWHGEAFDLPAGAQLLAYNENFPNQAFRYGENAYGLQFHPEVTQAMMNRWTTGAVHRLAMPGAQSKAEQLRKRHLAEPAVDQWLPGFLRLWLGEPVDGAATVAAE